MRKFACMVCGYLIQLLTQLPDGSAVATYSISYNCPICNNWSWVEVPE